MGASVSTEDRWARTRSGLLYTSIPLYLKLGASDSTTVKVSRETVRKLAALQRSLHAASMDETIGILVRRHRKEILESAFGVDKGRVSPFTERDRGEGRS